MLTFTVKQHRAPRPRAAPISIATVICSHTRFRSLRLSRSLPASVMSSACRTYGLMSQAEEMVRSDARNLLRQWVFLMYRLRRRCHHRIFPASQMTSIMVYPGLRPSRRVFVCRIYLFRPAMSARGVRKRCCCSTRLLKEQSTQAQRLCLSTSPLPKTQQMTAQMQALDRRSAYSSRPLLPVPDRLLTDGIRCQRTHNRLSTTPKWLKSTNRRTKRKTLAIRCIFTACASRTIFARVPYCRGSSLLMHQSFRL